MTEQKDNKELHTPDINTPGSSGPGFSGINNLKLNDLGSSQAKESLISKLNAEEGNRPQQEEVKFESLRIQPTEEKATSVSL